jgi:hypothetical protein
MVLILKRKTMSLRLIKTEILNELKTNLFIETGTLSGDGITYALELGFKNIISIDYRHYEAVYKKFSKHTNVQLITGDSGIYIWDAIKDKNQQITFWLDAHDDLIPCEKWNPICPLLEELNKIKKHHIKNHHILIDDITPIIKIPGISKSIIEKNIIEINNDYKISYVDTGGTQTLIASTNGKDYNDNSPAYE